MKSFSSLNIEIDNRPFSGDKVEIDSIINKPIEVLDYKIEKSKFQKKGGEKCLHLQIKIEDKTHVVFTGSGILMAMIQKTTKGDLPFTTTIVKEQRCYKFT